MIPAFLGLVRTGYSTLGALTAAIVLASCTTDPLLIILSLGGTLCVMWVGNLSTKTILNVRIERFRFIVGFLFGLFSAGWAYAIVYNSIQLGVIVSVMAVVLFELWRNYYERVVR